MAPSPLPLLDLPPEGFPLRSLPFALLFSPVPSDQIRSRWSGELCLFQDQSCGPRPACSSPHSPRLRRLTFFGALLGLLPSKEGLSTDLPIPRRQTTSTRISLIHFPGFCGRTAVSPPNPPISSSRSEFVKNKFARKNLCPAESASRSHSLFIPPRRVSLSL